ncbi:MAG: OmpA family protein [Terrimicrobiaceae bacterium]|nr:OmpA family protein [Terrimicrobiaceae bacterium]
MKRPLFFLSLALVVASALPACNKKKSDLYAGIDGDYVSGTPLGERFDGASFFGSTVQRGQFSPVYFGYDSFEVGGGEQAKIEQVATAMRDSSSNLIVAGFTDERGTEEYNRGLGERRALAVRQALIDAGVPAGRIQTVSFGEEMPADPGSGESAWALNRRAEFGVVK